MKNILILISLVLFIATDLLAGDVILLPIPEEKIEYGCGCGYYSKTSNPIQTFLQAELQFQEPRAYISDGLVHLKPIEVQGIPIDPKIGDTFTQHYRYKDIDLYFRNTVTFVCPNGMEGGCEVTKFKTRLEIHKDGKVNARQLVGDCGC